MGTNAAPQDRILKVKQLPEKVGLSIRTIYQLIRQAKFPKPVQLSPNRRGWKESDLNTWIAERVNP